MRYGMKNTWKATIGRILVLPAALLLMAPFALGAQDFASTSDLAFDPEDVTFKRDIAPILQRSCQNCHNPVGVAPMPLVTYDDARRFSVILCMANEQGIDLDEAFDAVMEKYHLRDGERWVRKEE